MNTNKMYSKTLRKKILITGSSGMLGRSLVDVLTDFGHEVYGMDKVLSNHDKVIHTTEIDLLDYPKLRQTIIDIQPDIVVHAVAIVNLSYCETHKDQANSLHVIATQVIAKACESLGAKLIYISTDSVFDGEYGNYSEHSIPRPVNHYAYSKYLGEKEAKQCNNHLIVRTNIYGLNNPLKGSIAEWAIKSWEKGEYISGYQDVFFNPVYTVQLAKIINNMFDTDVHGSIINIAQKEKISKYEFLERLNNTLGFDSFLLKSVSKSSQSQIKRPSNTTLDVSLLSQYVPVPSIEEGMQLLKEDYKNLQ